MEGWMEGTKSHVLDFCQVARQDPFDPRGRTRTMQGGKEVLSSVVYRVSKRPHSTSTLARLVWTCCHRVRGISTHSSASS